MLGAEGSGMPSFLRDHRRATAIASKTHARINTTGIGTGPTLDIKPPVQSSTDCMVEVSRPGCKRDDVCRQAALRPCCITDGDCSPRRPPATDGINGRSRRLLLT